MSDEKTMRIYVALEDKIGLPNYSSATASASLSREIIDPGGDEGLELAAAEMRRMADQVVEVFIATERDKVLDMVQGNVSS